MQLKNEKGSRVSKEKNLLIVIDLSCLFNNLKFDTTSFFRLLTLVQNEYKGYKLYFYFKFHKEKKANEVFAAKFGEYEILNLEELNILSLKFFKKILIHSDLFDFFTRSFFNFNFSEIKIFDNYDAKKRSNNNIKTEISFKKLDVDLQFEIKKKIEKLYLSNVVFKKLKSKNNNKVLLITPYHFAFYIGDSKFWFSEVKKVSLLLEHCLDNTQLDVVHTNKFLFEKFNNMYGENLIYNNFNYNDLFNINYNDYDLILCSSYELLKLLLIAADDNISIKEKILSYDLSLESKTINKFYSQFNFFSNFTTESIKDNRKIFRNSESICITGEEKKWADNELNKMGIEKLASLVILPAGASLNSKLLNRKVFTELVEFLVYCKNKRPLIFDFDGTIEANFKIDFKADLIKNIVFVNNSFNLRKDMSIMSSKYVCGIISPCTGIAHLYNAINFSDSTKLQYAIVYTGKNIFGNNTELVKYSPKRWWGKSKLKCLALDRNSNELITCNKYSDWMIFENQFRHVNEITFKHLKTYINSANL